MDPNAPVKRGRGRPPKIKPIAATAPPVKITSTTETLPAIVTNPIESPLPVKKKRGRPPKNPPAAQQTPTSVQVPVPSPKPSSPTRSPSVPVIGSEEDESESESESESEMLTESESETESSSSDDYQGQYTDKYAELYRGMFQEPQPHQSPEPSPEPFPEPYPITLSKKAQRFPHQMGLIEFQAPRKASPDGVPPPITPLKRKGTSSIQPSPKPIEPKKIEAVAPQPKRRGRPPNSAREAAPKPIPLNAVVPSKPPPAPKASVVKTAPIKPAPVKPAPVPSNLQTSTEWYDDDEDSYEESTWSQPTTRKKRPGIPFVSFGRFIYLFSALGRRISFGF